MPRAPAAGPETTSTEKPSGALRGSAQVHPLPPRAAGPQGPAEGTPAFRMVGKQVEGPGEAWMELCLEVPLPASVSSYTK